jgi:hypothetical protein
MIINYFLNILFVIIGGAEVISLFFSFTMMALVISTFVLSILHIRQYDKKGFAITSLVISSIFLLVLVIAFIYSVIIGLNAN